MRSKAAGKFFTVTFGVAVGLLSASGNTEGFAPAIAQAQPAPTVPSVPNLVDPRAIEAERLRKLGETQMAQEKYPNALTTFRQLIDLSKQLGDRPTEGFTWRMLGNVYFRLNDFDQAEAAQEMARSIAQEIQDSNLESRALFNLALIAENRTPPSLKQAEQIEQFLTQSLAIAEKSKNRTMVLMIIQALNRLYTNQKKVDKAISLISKVEEIIQKSQTSEEKLEAIKIRLGLQSTILTQESTLRNLMLRRERGLFGSGGSSIGIFGIGIDKVLQTLPVIANQFNDMEKLAQEGRAIALKLNDQESFQAITITEALTYQKIGNFLIEKNAPPEVIQPYFTKAIELSKSIQDTKTERFGINSLISFYLKQGKYNQVQPLLDRALAISEQNQDSIGRILDVNMIAAQYVILGDYAKSAELFQENITKGIAVDSKRLSASDRPYWISALSDAFEASISIDLDLGKTDRARRTAETWQKWARTIQSKPQEALALARQVAIGKPVATGKPIERTEKTGVTAQLLQSVQTQSVRSQLEQSWTLIQDLPKDETLETENAKVKVARQLSDFYIAENQGDRAIKVLQTTLDSLAESLASNRDRSSEINGLRILTLSQLSTAHLSQKQYREATQAADQAASLAKSMEKLELQIGAMILKTQIDAAQGESSQFLKQAQDIIVLADRLPNPGRRGTTLISVGTTYFQLGAYPIARSLFERVYQESKANGIDDLTLTATSMLSLLAFSEGDMKQAIARSEESLKLSKGKTSPSVILSYLTAGTAHGELKNGKQAIDALQNALTLARSYKNNAFETAILSVLGSIEYRAGRYDRSIEYYESTLALKSRPSKAEDLDRENQFTYAGLARNYAAKKQIIPAIAFYKKAINGIESTRKSIRGLPQEFQQSFLQSTIDFGGLKTSDVYRQLADLLIQQGRIAEAQQVLELLKIQELNDINPAVRSNPTRLAELALNTTEQTLQIKHDNLITFGQKTRDCQQNCTELKGQLRSLRGEFETYVQTIQQGVTDGTLVRIDERNKDFIASASKIVNSNPNSVLIYPLVLQDKTHLLWASKGGVLSSATCPLGEAQLNKTIGAFQQALATEDDISLVMKHGKTLYDCLVKPLREKGDWDRNNIQHLIIAADRAIHYLPIAALYDGEKFLIERYTVSNILNAGLTNVEDKLPPQPTVLGFGISDAIGDASPLPNVNQELTSIVRSEKTPSGIYPGKLFFNQATTVSNLEDNLAKYPILHIATHGVFNAAQPNQSYLLFSDGKPGGADRYTVSQIQQQDDLRNVHLVILSACQTAQTEALANGTEIQSMSAAFLRDRAKSVIASLWNVNDLSTSRLMQLFYQNLATGRLTKAQALRQAQLQLLNAEGTPTDKRTIPSRKARSGQRSDVEVQFTGTTPRPQAPNMAHPYYWAPFILIGNSQ